MTLDLNTCDQVCTECVKCYKKKHNIVSGSGGKFKIYCEGIPSEYIKPDLLQILPEEQAKAALSLMDPVAWAAQTLDWHCVDEDGSIWKRKNPDEYQRWVETHPGESLKGHSRYHRPYQQTMLRCSSKRKVFRLGRQLGKCLESFTKIQMADGSIKNIQDIQNGDLVLGLNDDYQFIPTPAFLYPNKEVDTLKITLSSGQTISASLNHPFLQRKALGRETTGKRRVIYQDEWTESSDLKIGDYIAVPVNIGDIGQEDYLDDIRKLKLIGFLLADGNITGGNSRFSNITPQILKEVSEGLSLFGCELVKYPSCKNADWGIVYSRRYGLPEERSGLGHKKPLRRWLDEIGIYGKKASEKTIPEFIFKLKSSYISKFLSALWGCDGWACVDKTDNVQVGYCTVSYQLAQQIVALLLRFGIYSSCHKKSVKYKDTRRVAYQILISRKQDIWKFAEHIGICGKEEQLSRVCQFSKIKKTSQKTDNYLDGDISFSRVIDISTNGKVLTWDLSVPGCHNFIANNIVTHNTETLCVSILYHMFVKPGKAKDESFTVIVITPYQSQIELIFKRLNELISSSPIIGNSIKRSVKAPNYSLELYNGSSILGFTAGTKSAGNADAVRGQHGDMLVFDESDLLNPSDIDSALAIVTNHPNATVWMSSTPTGKREKFYQTCHSKLYKEFYATSMANPLWSEELESLYKEQLTELGYKHEVLAEFGEQEEGVFQNTYVEAAKLNYTYGQLVRNPDWIYGLGVDWNDTKIGTDITIIGFNPTTSVFFVMQREVVTKEGWTQISACQKIVDLNAFWHPAFIYIDKGFGSTQDEILRKRGYDAFHDPNRGPSHPDAKLKDIVKTYDFGSSIEIRDLITQQPIKKAAKPFLVENAVRRFETRAIYFSNKDELLEKQLLNYIICRKTSAGLPVYKAGNEAIGDHALDSLMLALVGFTLEKTPFGKPIYSSEFAFIPSDIAHTDSVDKGSLGGTKISDPEYRGQDQRAEQRPSMNRSSKLVEKESIISHVNEIPAANLNKGVGASTLWSWPGFDSDAPRPQMKPFGEVLSEARNKNRSYPSKPRRKMF